VNRLLHTIINNTEFVNLLLVTGIFKILKMGHSYPGTYGLLITYEK